MTLFLRQDGLVAMKADLFTSLGEGRGYTSVCLSVSVLAASLHSVGVGVRSGVTQQFLGTVT